MKMNAKRRRSKEEIKNQKQADIKRAHLVEEKLLQFEQMQDRVK